MQVVIIKIFLFVFWSTFFLITEAQNIIPLPQQSQKGIGEFALNKAVSIVYAIQFSNEASQLLQQLKNITGLTIIPLKKNNTSNQIVLKQSIAELQDGGYKLTVSTDKIVIEAKSNAGAFYGCMSLLQLLPIDRLYNAAGNTTHYAIASVTITDYPRFQWRGLMLDCARTFISIKYLKQTIDRLSFYKMNTLHLHLTDDQGWRLEIEKRSLLAKKAAYFDRRYDEPAVYQGYYTQQEIKDIIAYAAKKNVQIVPEIESPGHSVAALNAYPALSCTGNVPPVYPYFSGPGVTKDVFCVGNPGSFEFYKDVLTEVDHLFPSPYIHLGGDEVPINRWEKCPKCQRLIKEKGLENTGALQGYFMQGIAQNVRKAGKRPVAWDEILEQEKYIDKSWIIMSWRGVEPGLKAAMAGYDVVLTPNSHMYFDYGYDKINTKRVFQFDPYNGNNTDNIRKHVLGIQANFWSHIDRTPSKIDYQLYPRLLALAERAWSAAEDKDYEAFKLREQIHKLWLTKMNVKFNTWEN